jgi:hypothetical protein
MSTYNQQQWQDEYEDQPIRLLITCRRAGYEPWTLLREVVAGARTLYTICTRTLPYTDSQ